MVWDHDAESSILSTSTNNKTYWSFVQRLGHMIQSKKESDTIKKCSKCGKVKPLEDFHKNGFKKDGTQKYRGYCKECANKIEIDRYHKKQEMINEHKDTCAKCGENRYYVLDFHHVEPSEKEFTISQVKIGSKERILNEIDKCIVLCANCHRAFHHLNKFEGISLEDFLNDKDL